MSEAFQSLSFWSVAIIASFIFRLMAPRFPGWVSKVAIIVLSFIFLDRFFGGRSFFLLFSFWVVGCAIVGFALRKISVHAKGALYGVALLAIVSALIVLKYPSYSEFLSGGLVSGHASGWIGLSYLAFRSIDMLSQARSTRLKSFSLLDVVAYLTFFPSFVAGPINRFAPFCRDVGSPAPLPSVDEVRNIFWRISIGIIKIIFVARLFEYNSIIYFDLSDKSINMIDIVGGLYAYYLYIYFDFSGYTDMMIGLSRIFGIRLPENFNFPFLATSIQDFWNRWHISLSHWFRDHVFFPSFRKLSSWMPPVPASAAAIFVTFVLVGSWHGDSWHWVMYGVYHGTALACWSVWSQVWRTVRPDVYDRLVQNGIYRVSCTIATFNFIALGLVLTLDSSSIRSIINVVWA